MTGRWNLGPARLSGPAACRGRVCTAACGVAVWRCDVSWVRSGRGLACGAAWARGDLVVLDPSPAAAGGAVANDAMTARAVPTSVNLVTFEVLRVRIIDASPR